MEALGKRQFKIQPRYLILFSSWFFLQIYRAIALVLAERSLISAKHWARLRPVQLDGQGAGAGPLWLLDGLRADPDTGGIPGRLVRRQVGAGPVRPRQRPHQPNHSRRVKDWPWQRLARLRREVVGGGFSGTLSKIEGCTGCPICS